MSGSAEIDVVILGLSHRTAPVAMRERLAVVPERRGDGVATHRFGRKQTNQVPHRLSGTWYNNNTVRVVPEI